MDENKKSLDAAFFNNLYQENGDPWNFEQSEYEHEKYHETLKMIPAESYDYAFEIGCSNGVLTQMLLPKCKRLLAVDASRIAVENAKNRLGDNANATIQEMEIPRDFPNEKFDLILFSEIGYFLSMEDLLETRDKMIESLNAGAHLLLVHWTPLVDEFPLTGDQVHEQFLAISGEDSQPLLHLNQRIEEQYRMDLFERK